MLAPAKINPKYTQWNQKWSAPFGPAMADKIPRNFRLWPLFINLCQEFSFQPNNDTRIFEYPWVHEQIGPKPGLNIVEIGGGLAGFQFVLQKLGHKYTNVDPGMAARGKGWSVDEAKMHKLNQKFGTDVKLKNCFIEEAELPDQSVDRVLSISTIEHIPKDDVSTILEHVKRILKPGGLFIMTVDLFLDLIPFTAKSTNTYGSNIDMKWLIESSGLNLVEGDKQELFGHEEFNPSAIESKKSKYLVGNGYPVMVQAVVLEKR